MKREENHSKLNRGQEGQIGLITLLIMTVMLSVGISVVNRSTKDLRISRQEEEASKIFNSAEAGIEEGLRDLSSCTPDNPCSGSLDFGEAGTEDIPINVEYTAEAMREFEAVVPENVTATIDTTGAVNGSQLTIEWGANQVCADNVAAIEVMVYHTTNYTVRREGYSPACSRGDRFVAVAASGGVYRVVIALVSGENLVRIKPLYNDTALKVTGNWAMNTQYYRIRSVGTSDVGDETKVIEVTRTLPSAPSIFDYVLYSGGSLVK